MIGSAAVLSDLAHRIGKAVGVCLGDLKTSGQDAAANPGDQAEGSDGEDQAGHWFRFACELSIGCQEGRGEERGAVQRSSIGAVSPQAAGDSPATMQD